MTAGRKLTCIQLLHELASYRLAYIRYWLRLVMLYCWAGPPGRLAVAGRSQFSKPSEKWAGLRACGLHAARPALQHRKINNTLYIIQLITGLACGAA